MQFRFGEASIYPFEITMLSNLQKKLLTAAKVPPPRAMFGGEVRALEQCSYCMTKYSTGDEVYATPGCLTQQQDIPAIGGQFPRDIRRYLRSNRYQDSAPERRADVEGLYQFPACCSCCKCPTCVERLPGAESPQRRLRINDGDDGGFGIGEGDGFFDGGGYVGFSANEDHYIHMISDEKKAYMRAQCLQQEVRYGFPQVGYISRNEEDEAIV